MLKTIREWPAGYSTELDTVSPIWKTARILSGKSVLLRSVRAVKPIRMTFKKFFRVPFKRATRGNAAAPVPEDHPCYQVFV